MSTPRRWDWFVTRCDDAVARLRALVTSRGEDPFFGAVWESLSPMIEWLAALDASSWLALDLREIAEIGPDGALRPQVAAAARPSSSSGWDGSPIEPARSCRAGSTSPMLRRRRWRPGTTCE